MDTAPAVPAAPATPSFIPPKVAAILAAVATLMGIVGLLRANVGRGHQLSIR